MQQKQSHKHTAYNIKDDLGREINFVSPPKRVFSLAPSITETIFVLREDSILVGVTSYCDFPEAAKMKPKIGDLISPNVEKIVGLQPDLVLMTVEGNTKQVFDKLNHLGLRIFVTNPRNLAGILDLILTLGRIFQTESRAEAVSDSLSKIATEVIERTKNRKEKEVLALISLDPIMAVGSTTFLGEVISTAGGENLIRKNEGNYPVLNREEILKRNPDILLLSSDIFIGRTELLRRFPEWRYINAVQDSAIYPINANLFLRPGPRIYSALQILAEMIHQTKKRRANQ